MFINANKNSYKLFVFSRLQIEEQSTRETFLQGSLFENWCFNPTSYGWEPSCKSTTFFNDFDSVNTLREKSVFLFIKNSTFFI